MKHFRETLAFCENKDGSYSTKCGERVWLIGRTTRVEEAVTCPRCIARISSR